MNGHRQGYCRGLQHTAPCGRGCGPALAESPVGVVSPAPWTLPPSKLNGCMEQPPVQTNPGTAGRAARVPIDSEAITYRATPLMTVMRHHPYATLPPRPHRLPSSKTVRSAIRFMFDQLFDVSCMGSVMNLEWCARMSSEPRRCRGREDVLASVRSPRANIARRYGASCCRPPGPE